MNRSFKYCLCVIDNFSKMAFMRPLKNKSSEAVSTAMEDIFRKSKRVPEKIHHDEGKEFMSKRFNDLMEQYGISSYHTHSEIKCGIIER